MKQEDIIEFTFWDSFLQDINDSVERYMSYTITKNKFLLREAIIKCKHPVSISCAYGLSPSLPAA